MTKQLTLADYDTLEAVGYEEDLFYSFVNEYTGSTYICEVIAEIADNYTPIYNWELWEKAPKVKDYIESAIDEGLTGEGSDLMRTFQTGIYYYNEQVLNENEASIYYNYIAVIVNKWLETLNYDQLEKIDINEIDERIEEDRADIDRDSYIEDLEDIAKRVIAEFKGRVNKDASWENYGDVNALEHGGVFIKKDTDYPLDKCYYVVKVINMDSACGEEGYMVEECYMDLKDDWIDWEAVESTCDIAESDGVKVCDLLSYYGITEFNGETYEFDNESEVLEHLAEQGICIEN